MHLKKMFLETKIQLKCVCLCNFSGNDCLKEEMFGQAPWLSNPWIGCVAQKPSGEDCHTVHPAFSCIHGCCILGLFCFTSASDSLVFFCSAILGYSLCLLFQNLKVNHWVSARIVAQLVIVLNCELAVKWCKLYMKFNRTVGICLNQGVEVSN